MRRLANLMVSLTLSACVFLCTSCQKAYVPLGEKMPEGFKIAAYPGSTCTKSDTMPLANHETQQIAVLLTKDDVYKIETFYKTELALEGFLLSSDNEIKGSITLEANSDKQKATITMSPIGDEHTVISIAVIPRPK